MILNKFVARLKKTTHNIRARPSNLVISAQWPFISSVVCDKRATLRRF